MSSTDRQSRLLATEDWKKIYQSFRNADLQSYDFDNLRRTMINYLRQNYPEDFNDYIESSEYLALIDLIAFLGQNLSFRVDLNARENFLETAERRESVLRLARLISYNPKRNQAANGLLKIESLSTTESVLDSAGINLSGITVRWNDRGNNNYREQFTKILNAALPTGNGIGNPQKKTSVDGVITEKYKVNGLNTNIPVFPFSKSIEGISTEFEIVNADINNGTIVEESPIPGNSPSFLYRDDGQGAGSSNSGFFVHFRQGRLQNGKFAVNNPIPNQIISIDATDINNSDVWLYKLDSNDVESEYWQKIDTVEGNNIIYNSVFENERRLYSVTTRVDDRINLVFSDGVFGDLPSGNFRVYYRTSDNRNMIITPSSMTGVAIEIDYLSKNNTREKLTLTLGLRTTVTNSRPSESSESIKRNAPATYYTQNRLITAEDYNIGPLGISQDIIKTKSVNRISSGISRYYDLNDPSGKYSTTNLFANDGVIYKQEYNKKVNFSFNTESDIEGVIYNTIEPIISSVETRNFYEERYDNIFVNDLDTYWNQVTEQSNRSTGYFESQNNNIYEVGSFTTSSLKYIEPGALCKFIAPAGFYFLEDGELTQNVNDKTASEYMWTMVQFVRDSGTEIDGQGFGPIVFNNKIPSNSVLVEIIPKLSKVLDDDLKTQIIDRAFAYKDFAIRYNQEERRWVLVTAENINTFNDFSLGKTGNTDGLNLDSSWLLYFKTDGETYEVVHRNLRYVFESEDEIKFYFDSADKIFDTKKGKVVRDTIKILSINTKNNELVPFNKDFDWSISDSYKDADGYIDTRKVQIKFFDSDDDAIPDNPTIFNEILGDEDTLIFQKKYKTSDGVEDYRYFSNITNEIIVVNQERDPALDRTKDGQVYYLKDEKVFKKVDINLNNLPTTTEYRAFVGRDNLKFHYIHVADSNYRIDPASSNIIDTYVLTKGYDTEFRKYLKGGVLTKPLPPSTSELTSNFGNDINKIKSISDEVVMHPVKYKMLFGDKSREDLQVTFKVVKNSGISTNDNAIKTSVIEAINRFFSIDNWNFGDTFYFQELSTYIMNSMSPDISSIVIVPKQASQSFGSLFEIKSESDEIFISTAEVKDVEIISENTASELQASGKVVTSVPPVRSGITSSGYGG